MKKINFYNEIQKAESQEDGTIKVWGYASSGNVDSDGEVITPEAMQKAFDGYMKFGAVREMHGSNAAGTAIEISLKEDGKTWFGAHIVDPTAVLKVKTGTYKGFSIGGRATKRDDLNKSIITALDLIEISLVDRPANPDAVFEMFKADIIKEENMEQENLEVEKQEEVKTEEVIVDTEKACGPKEEKMDEEEKETEKVEVEIEVETEEDDDEEEESMEEEKPVEEEKKKAETDTDIIKLTNEIKNDKLTEEIEKVNSLNKALTEMTNKAEQLAKDNEQLIKRIKELEDMPVEPKAVLKVVGKGGDSDSEEIKVAPVLKAGTNEVDDIATLIKKAQQNGKIIKFN